MRYRLVVSMAMAMILSWSVPGSAQSADKQPAKPLPATDRTKSANNLKEIGLAFHNFELEKGYLPRDIIDKNGKPILSWRVAILPYLEVEDLEKQFKLDEPWDGANNKKLLEMMPKIFMGPGGKAEKGHTFYQSFAGTGAMMSDKKSELSDIPDGTSNTFMVIEAGAAVPWTKPADIAFDPKKPLPALGGLFMGSFNVCFADGAVRFVKKGVADEILKKYITLAGGEDANGSELDP